MKVDGVTMRDYLKELCETLNINLIYTSNKLVVLSPIINNNVPSIRAHKMFKNCADEVARAIVSYCSGKDIKGENYKIVEDYASKNFKSEKFRIVAPNEEYKGYFSKTIMSTNFNKKSDDPSLVEIEIAQIKKVDFWGKSTDITRKGTFSIEESEMIELDIEVNEYRKI
jgi:hypothetical protein